MVLAENILFANRYTLIQKLGTGGFSEVWLADDTKSEGIQVALKIYAPGSGLDANGLKVFSHEYAVVFNLNHPNLLRPSHYDDWNGMPYLVLQYMPKGNCQQLCGKMTEPELARFLMQIGSALQYLHAQHPPVVHQDIKPENILIDDQGNYLLTDFGISTRIRRTLTRSMGNRTGSSGTTAYMAPERFSENLIDREPICANDIFALGVTLFELLTDELPYGEQGGIVAAGGLKPAKLPEKFSEGLRKLVNNCVSKKTWKRPTAGELYATAKSYENGVWLLPERMVNLDQRIEVSKRDEQHTQILFPEPTAKTVSDSSHQAEPEKKRFFPMAIIWPALIIAVIGITLVLWQPWKQRGTDTQRPVAQKSIAKQVQPVGENRNRKQKEHKEYLQKLLQDSIASVMQEEIKKGNQETGSPKLKIGDTYAGGIIFYLDASGEHGMVCAQKDQGEYRWGCGLVGTVLTFSDLGKGKTNTIRIVNSCGSSTAAGVCYTLNMNGHNDWYLPSQEELNLMYENLKKKGIGVFTNNKYWCSSEKLADYAYSQSFYFGLPGSDFKVSSNYVRCARSF